MEIAEGRQLQKGLQNGCFLQLEVGHLLDLSGPVRGDGS